MIRVWCAIFLTLTGQVYGQGIDLQKLQSRAFVNPDSVLQVANNLLQDYEIKWTTEEQGFINKIIGDTYYKVDSLKLSARYYYQALSLLPAASDSIQARINGNLSYIIADQKQFSESNSLIDKVLRTYQKYDLKHRIAILQSRKALNHVRLNNLDSAAFLFYDALERHSELGDRREVSQMIGNLSLVLKMNNKFEDAFEYLLKSIELSKQINDSTLWGTNLLNLATFYADRDFLDSAEIYARDAVRIGRAIRHQKMVVRSENIIARVALQNHDYKTVIQICEHSIHSEDDQARCVCNKYLAKALYALGRETEAFVRASASIDDCYTYGLYDYVADMHKILYELNKKSGSPTQALHHLERYKALADSTLNADNFAKIEELQTKYETSLKTQQITELRQQAEIQVLELRQQRILIALTIALAILVLGIIYFIYRQSTLKAQRNELMASQKLLRAQINPHFLFNALTSIQKHLYLHKDIDASTEYLTQFSRLMRSILDSSIEEFVTLEEEISMIKDYLRLQQMRSGVSFEYEVVVSELLEVDQVVLPPMLMQPFIENAIEHGFKKEQNDYLIRLHFDLIDNQLKVDIQDNGEGFEMQKGKAASVHKSRAVEITKNRIKLLGKHLKEKVLFTIEPQPAKGVKVTFLIPLLKE